MSRSPRDPGPAEAPEAPVRFTAHDPFIRRVAAALVLTILAGVALTLAVKGLGVLFAAFAGILFAVLLNVFARGIERHTPLGYPWALGAVVLLICAVLALAVWLLGAEVVEQAEQFAAMLPGFVAQAEAYLQQRGWGQWLLSQAQENSGGGGGGGGPEVLAGGMTVLSRLSDIFTYLLVTIFVGLFAAANPRLYVDGIVSLTPPGQRRLMREMLDAIDHALRWWLIGQGAAMLLIGVSTTIVLWLFGVPLAIVVGLIVGLLGFIPYLGPIIGLLPVALVAATAGGATLLWVLLAYTGVQMLEGYVATPLIHERTVYLPPVFTIILQILLGVVLGIKGIVLATPLAAVLLVASRFYRRDFLGEPDVDVHPSH
jgi:predicted PurR-regulated permease PerM